MDAGSPGDFTFNINDVRAAEPSCDWFQSLDATASSNHPWSISDETHRVSTTFDPFESDWHQWSSENHSDGAFKEPTCELYIFLYKLVTEESYSCGLLTCGHTYICRQYRYKTKLYSILHIYSAASQVLLTAATTVDVMYIVNISHNTLYQYLSDSLITDAQWALNIVIYH